MGNKIIILDKVTANQIAAGEVVENPASVVKELIENSIDAKSENINVKIKAGGLKEIRVIDNGIGMSKEDIALSLARHGTSKIFSVTDLNKLETLGFRGEALPSIASVSNIELISRRPTDLEGNYLKAMGGEIQKIQEIGTPVGTDIRVNNLFFNTPARLKYVKSSTQEISKIIDIINRMALAYPNISFSLEVEKRKVFNSSGRDDLLEVVGEIYGAKTLKDFINFNYQDEYIKIQGILAKPVFSKSTKYHQTYFVNKRIVQSKLLSRALEDGYHTLLPKGRHPVCVLNIFINPDSIDINVHPTKKVIRFSNETTIYNTLMTAIKNALTSVKIFKEYDPASKNTNIPPKEIDIFKDKIPGIEIKKSPSKEVNYSQNEDNIILNRSLEDYCKEEYQDLKEIDTNRYNQIIGQYYDTYIICQDENNNLALIDQHAAHERILYEKLKNEQRTKVNTLQQILPEVIELDKSLQNIIKNHLHIFKEIGFNLEEFGNNAFILRTIPVFLKNIYTSQLVIDIIEEILQGNTLTSEEEIKDSIYKVIACKAAVKANQKLSLQEMKNIVLNFNKTNHSSCPHGRPAKVLISLKDIAKNFLRHN